MSNFLTRYFVKREFFYENVENALRELIWKNCSTCCTHKLTRSFRFDLSWFGLDPLTRACVPSHLELVGCIRLQSADRCFRTQSVWNLEELGGMNSFRCRPIGVVVGCSQLDVVDAIAPHDTVVFAVRRRLPLYADCRRIDRFNFDLARFTGDLSSMNNNVSYNFEQ